MRLVSVLFAILFFVFSFTLQASPSELQLIPEEMLLNEPSCIVNNSVNIITGNYHESAVDMEVAGPHPLVYQRSYISGDYGDGDLGRCWNTNHLGKAKIEEPGDGSSSISLTGDLGTSSTYSGKVPRNKEEMITHKIDSGTFNKYMTNCPDFCFSKGSHVRNNRLFHKKNSSDIMLVTGNGYLRNYKKINEQKKHSYPEFLMDCEKHPNGCSLRYTEGPPKHISLQNENGKELSALAITNSGAFVTVNGSDGQWVRYHFHCAYHEKSKYSYRPAGYSYYLSLVEGSNIPVQAYEYSSINDYRNPKIVVKHSPDGRYLANEYYKRGKHHAGRIMCQKAPVGVDVTPIVTHSYSYDFKTETIEYDLYNSEEFIVGGCTSVLDAHQHKTDYFFNEDFRLTDIWRWKQGNQEVYSIEKSYWGENNTSNSTNLISRTLANGQNEVKLCRSYIYDDYGNALHKILWGNLSGRQTGSLFMASNGLPYINNEHHIKSYTYLPFPSNQLLTESDGKKTIEYTYRPFTNLVAGQIVKVGDKVLKREFKGYDDNGCIIHTIVDNGPSPSCFDHSLVTEQHITNIKNTAVFPIGLPEEVEQSCVDFDAGKVILQGKVRNQYSPVGKLISQEHYDSESVLRYTLEWEYDKLGNVTMEKDALGRVINRKYDANSNLIYEQGPVPGFHKEFRYDFMNRLIGTTEVHPDGTKLTNSYRYDFLGNMIASVDAYGQETRYAYDHLNRLIETIYPTVLNERTAHVQPVTRIEYDLFNNPTSITDAAGGKTTILYTAYNKPYLKTYPDGTTESFEYYNDGNLQVSTAKNGTKTVYFYDAFDRVVAKHILSAENELLQHESNEYNAFHLLSTTDPDGVKTHFEYDYAGKLSAVTCGEMRTEYQYDTLGREHKILTFHGTGKEDYCVKAKEYDLLNRITEERIEDAFGNVQIKEVYDYDLQGNRNVIHKFNQTGESITTTEYNTRGQVVSITNDKGEQTHIHYRYDYYDQELDQYLPCSESTDPNGVITVSIQDALGRNKTEYKKDPFGKLIQKRDFLYTINNHLARTHDAVIVDGEKRNVIVNTCTYNPAGNLIEACEAAGTREQKTTKFTYNASGQKETETKPDGTLLHYSYDALGRLKEYHSSDKTFHYVYEYDRNGNPIRVVDNITGTETLKNFDQYNRLKKEILANGLTLEYAYDFSGKPTKVLFPDGSGMGMSYDHLFLKEVFRIGLQGEKRYTHTYEDFDLAGNVIHSTLIGKAGKACFEVDLNGRLTGISTDAWSGKISGFDKNGNVTKKTFRDNLGAYSCEYNYDGLNQLIEEAGDFSEQYVCDSLYNRIKKGKIDLRHNRLNQLLHDGKSFYEYDKNGNLIKISNDASVTELSYDALNRLIKVKKGEQQVVYTYDEMNRRLSKTVFEHDQKHTFQYFYQGLNEVGCYKDGKLTELRLLGLGKGAEIGAAVAMEFNDAVYAPIHDLHGNVVCLVDADTGNVKEFYRYSAFGEESVYDEEGTSKASLNPWRFSSKRTDSETGYVYFGRRYYDSHLGRWITPDPIGYEGGPNLYAYVVNNPLGSFDLYGLSAEEASAAGGSERSFFDGVKDFFRSAYEGIRDGIVGICNSVADGLATVTNALCDTFRSYREERQVSFNQRMLNSAMNKLSPNSHTIGPGEYAAIYFTNGINTIFGNFLSHCAKIFELAGNALIQGVYNPSNSFLHDVARVFLSLNFYMASNVIAELHAQWNYHFETYGNVPLLQICHSEGTTNVRNALMCYNPELRNLIDVLAIAPSGYIDRNLCRNVDHYVSTRDFVPWFDFTGRARNRETVHVLPAHKEANFWDHDFQSPTYEKVIQHHINKHLKNLGK